MVLSPKSIPMIIESLSIQSMPPLLSDVTKPFLTNDRVLVLNSLVTVASLPPSERAIKQRS